MPLPESVCLLCETPITREIDSKEHVVPNAIGGRLKVKGFLCRTCNSTRGQYWETALASQFTEICLLYAIVREDGETPSSVVTTSDGEKLLWRNDGTMTVEHPTYTKQEVGTGHRVSIIARTELEARSMAKGARKKLAADDVTLTETPLRTDTAFLGKPLQFNLQFGGPLAGRSMVKTAIAMAHRAGVSYSRCDIAAAYLNDPSDDARPPFGFSLPRDLVIRRPAEHLFHCVSVFGEEGSARLLAYVEYFGLCRVLVQLSATYSGPHVQSTYAVDPATGNEVDIKVDFNISDDELEEILHGQEFAQSAAVRAAEYAIPISLKSSQERTTAMVSEQAVVSAFKKLGLENGDSVPEDRMQELARYVAEGITPYVLHLKNAPPRPID